MTNRIRIAAALVGGIATISVSVPAVATPHEGDLRACVTKSEFGHVAGGDTRREVEERFDVKGHWVARFSDPGHDAYTYRACRKGVDVRVTYERHTREWSSLLWSQPVQG